MHSTKTSSTKQFFDDKRRSQRACLIVPMARWKHVLTIFTNGLEQREGAKFSDENAQNELYKKQQSSVKKLSFSAFFFISNYCFRCKL